MNAPQHTNEGWDWDHEPLPDDVLDYEARCAIRNLIRLYGGEMARDLIANFLAEELERRTIDA